VPPKSPRPTKPAKHAPTSEDKTTLRAQLRVFLDLRVARGDLTVAQLRRLRRLLTTGADALYRLADRVERDARVRVPRRLVDELAAHAARVGPTDDPVLAPVLATLARLREHYPAKPWELRKAAIQLLDLVDAVEDARLLPVPPALQRRRRAPVGRPRNWILDRILAVAARAHVSDAELAQALVDVGFPPEGPGSREASLTERWVAIVKSARARRRRRARAVPQ
jgi:hypothetical protein